MSYALEEVDTYEDYYYDTFPFKKIDFDWLATVRICLLYRRLNIYNECDLSWIVENRVEKKVKIQE
jgi:hypothetical protein